MNLKGIRLSEKSQSQNVTYCRPHNPLYITVLKYQITERQNGLLVARCWGGGEGMGEARGEGTPECGGNHMNLHVIKLPRHTHLQAWVKVIKSE